jgi:hypothetical protein
VKSAIEIMIRRADDLARELVARAPAGSIRAVFAGGSVGRDEVWARPEGATLVVHSDLDLYVVMTDDADERAVRDAVAAVASALPEALDGVVFLRGVDAGVYRTGDLLAQPARPGTVDLRERHRWLYGDRSILESLAPSAHRSIAASEALYLLENRAWDALDAVAHALGDARAIERSRVQAAKVILDVGAAHLIAEARFVSTYAARMAALRSRAPSRLTPRTLAAIEASEAVRLGGMPESAIEARDALVLLAEAWCTLAPAILSVASPAVAERDGADAAALLSVRCARDAFYDNYREFLRLRRRARLSLVGAAAAGLRLATLSPRAALRTHALARGLVEAARVSAPALSFHADYVAALAARLGFDQGPIDARARAALRAVS